MCYVCPSCRTHHNNILTCGMQSIRVNMRLQTLMARSVLISVGAAITTRTRRDDTYHDESLLHHSVRLLPRTVSTSIMLATTMTYTILVPATANTTKVVATTVTI